jgi:hypothetical protein
VNSHRYPDLSQTTLDHEGYNCMAAIGIFRKFRKFWKGIKLDVSKVFNMGHM